MIEDWQKNERIGIFGHDGPCVVVLHGGPGAYGTSDAVAQELSKTCRTFSPWQRRSGNVRLSVDIHVEDLKDLIEKKLPDRRPTLVGESWGAMLALAFACKYPQLCRCLALTGCGTFSEETRIVMSRIRHERIKNHISKHPEFETDLQLPVFEQIMKWHDLTDTYCRLREAETLNPGKEFDRQAFDESWGDMIRCQNERIYPDSFANISCPVVMIHGEYDPHPGKMTAELLQTRIPQLEYKELAKCGHAPDNEKYARSEFYEFLVPWILGNS